MDFKYEMILPNEDLPFKMFLFEGKDGNYKRAKHWHKSVEIFLVTEGELEFYIDSTCLPLRAGEFVIVNSNEVHSVDSPLPNRTVVVQIPCGCFEGYLKEDSYAIFSRKSAEDDRELTRLVMEMYDIYQKKELAYELKVQSLFLELLYLLVTGFLEMEADQNLIRQKRHLDRLSQITSYMKQNYAQNITLESVADRFGFSPTYLSRMFHRYANVSYKTYLLNVRTEYGLREMMNTEHSLNDVALGNGFPNSRAFAKAFQKRYGCLPSEYRKKARK